ncbi:MAG: FecR domain-containing protein [Bacteroidales bacterium]|nr:FecR domain-containing protein [Bacteroidales bacterium]
MIQNDYIELYLSGQATEAETEELFRWVNENETNKKEFADACRLWYDIHSPKFNSEKAFNAFIAAQKPAQPKPKILPLWRKISAVAAMALLAIGCFTIFTNRSAETITIANTNTTVQTVTLPDGSTIYLQNGASITYPETFATTSRTVSATGNIFCEIARNEKAPFTLTNDQLTVKVLGTSFQVNSTHNASVVVESGKVQVSSGDQSVTIEKGERADITNNKLEKTTNTDINFLSWKTGLLQFRNTNLSQVFSDLSRHYKCEFVYSKSCADVTKMNLTGSYQDLSLSQVLQMIETAIPDFHYEITANEVVVSNK